ncbi:MAG: amine oxidase [Rhodospirillales bacterium CG15_BIG_FIL_POST_REV_8_21_14_020_66_15]|nr:MAG: amine oxidase [Rhodospirillales bacterium CG15_BIG_FIL_POST_REV_8_21_14_020_66_15]
MAAPRIHVIGAGVAGLAAAVRLAQGDQKVVLHDSAGHAGGRCRSLFDSQLDRRIDNGNHLILSGNRAIRDYLETVGAADSLTGPADASFPFRDLKTGETWVVRPDEGRVPWSVLFGPGRVPGTRLGEYLRALRLACAGPDETIRDCLAGSGPLFERFWEPLAVGVLNTPVETASAKLLWPVIKETFGRGRAACRPLMARVGLSESFVDPALDYLKAKGTEVRFNDRVRALNFGDERLDAIDFAGRTETLGPDDRVVLAVPAWTAADLVPGLDGPREAHAIVNAHFRLSAPPTSALPLVGLICGTAQWVFLRGDVASVTVSAADALAAEANDAIARKLWPEVRAALDLPADAGLPPWRIVKEKRATIAQTPAADRRRPPPRTRWDNLVLAGDWTATGLPATIEGAIRSGFRAADLVVTSLSSA